MEATYVTDLPEGVLGRRPVEVVVPCDESAAVQGNLEAIMDTHALDDDSTLSSYATVAWEAIARSHAFGFTGAVALRGHYEALETILDCLDAARSLLGREGPDVVAKNGGTFADFMQRASDETEHPDALHINVTPAFDVEMPSNAHVLDLGGLFMTPVDGGN